MTERITAAKAAALLLPLLAAAILVPAGLDQALDPLLVGGLPLAWAALWTIFFKADYRGMGAAFIAVLPFTAYALAGFASRPFTTQFLALVACSAAMTAVRALPRRGSAEPARAWISAAIALPCIIFMALAGPWPGMAVSALLAAWALYMRQRRLR